MKLALVFLLILALLFPAAASAQIDPAARRQIKWRTDGTCTFAHGIDPSGRQGNYSPYRERVHKIIPLSDGTYSVKFSCIQSNTADNAWYYVGIGVADTNPPIIHGRPLIGMVCEARYAFDENFRNPDHVRKYLDIMRARFNVCPPNVEWDPSMDPPH